MRRLQCDQNFDARPAWTTPPDFQRGNRRSACHEGENFTHRPPERRAAGQQAQDSTHRPWASENPATRRGDSSACRKSTQRLPRVENNDASPCVKGRNRRTHHFSTHLLLCGPLQRFFTPTRYFVLERDFGGHSDPGGRREPPAWREPFCVSRWAGGRPPEGRPPAQRETPSHEDAGSEWSRRSGKGATGAMQTLKFYVGPAYGGLCSAHAIPRHPSPPSCSWRSEPPGTGWR
ncbi:hypothetical protein NDU88_002620 [Pleurodeles waltl]|uniref:Uncharacterized protein n=1 Tax=Pleurodeles waltl TaxID=8319 RepID=A0AAV7T2R9_PLEWA|nr:hypothetical protein NDU88_002620 [Pleurodeles waltl]